MQGILHENYYYGQAEVAFGKQRQDGLYRETVLKKKQNKIMYKSVCGDGIYSQKVWRPINPKNLCLEKNLTQIWWHVPI